MKERNYVCEFYVRAHECTKDKDAEVFGICQHCSKYKKKAGSAPIRPDNRIKKMKKIMKREEF